MPRTHGATGYKAGCRCAECREGKRLEQRAYVAKVKARDGITPTQKYRPGKTVWSEHPCSACGVVVYGASESPICAKCRARSKRGVEIPRSERTAIYNRDGWTCGFCSGRVDSSLSGADLWGPTLDHIVPRSKGGADEVTNLRLVHRYCNSIRRDADALTLDELTA